jgi:TetR/AcrR family transcriptional repressor of bet genes
MARLTIRELRRGELIDATLAAIAEGGMSEITLATIAAQAGVSPALVNHYFDGKDDLLEAAMRRLAADLGDAFLEHLPADPGPMDRLHAVIDSCLLADNFRPGSMVTWLSFWAEVQHQPRFRRLHRIIARRFRSNVAVAMRKLVPAEKVEELVTIVTALVDGFWLRYVIDGPAMVPPEVSRRICRDLLAMCLAEAGAFPGAPYPSCAAAGEGRDSRPWSKAPDGGEDQGDAQAS